jgi:hypothetical protein
MWRLVVSAESRWPRYIVRKRAGCVEERDKVSASLYRGIFWCRREDSTELVLPDDTVSITSCPVSVSSVHSCCFVREKSSGDREFVSYPLAVGVLVSPLSVHAR